MLQFKCTPLAYAAADCLLDLARLMLAAGADPRIRIRDSRGKTALDVWPRLAAEWEAIQGEGEDAERGQRKRGPQVIISIRRGGQQRSSPEKPMTPKQRSKDQSSCSRKHTVAQDLLRLAAAVAVIIMRQTRGRGDEAAQRADDAVGTSSGSHTARCAAPRR